MWILLFLALLNDGDWDDQEDYQLQLEIAPTIHQQIGETRLGDEDYDDYDGDGPIYEFVSPP